MRKLLKHITCISLIAVLHIISLPITFAYAGQKISVPQSEAEGNNPYSIIEIGADGLPKGAKGGYTPAEMNPLLGNTPLMTPLECVKKYGVTFCACKELSDGSQYCYYNRPATGYYESMELCESIWGAGHCICSNGTNCRLYEPDEYGKQLECHGQVFFFSGEKFECRRSGVMTAGKNCCMSMGRTSSACSFKNVADELGMDDIAMTAMSLGNKLASLAGYDITEYISGEIAQIIVQNWIETGSVEGLMGSLTSLLGDQATDLVLENLSDVLAEELMQQAIEDGTMAALQEAAVAEVASMLSTMVSVAGWIYFAYKVYNMINSMRQCSPGELMLACKKAKQVCHKVGTRCKTKVLGACLQKMEVYCCFNSLLAKIIHEQGRPQIGRSWGKAKKPDCKGFTMDQFALIDLSSIPFGELYGPSLIEHMSPNLGEKLQRATENIRQNF